MRVRIKFSKTGMLKYIGHLDVMRFFQKALRRAGLDTAYSEGFHPHMLMSFAQPLGVGVTSEGEYFDLELKSAMTSAEMLRRINEQMPPEFAVTRIVQIAEDKASKCMSLVAAADYRVRFPGNEAMFDRLREKLSAFLQQEKIEVLKKTKRSEVLTDIRPLIYEAQVSDRELYLCLSCGSVNNCRPQLVLESFLEAEGIDPAAVPLAIHREELYAQKEGAFIPLFRLGEEIV